MKQLCVVLVLSLAGCSFFLTHGPRESSNPPRAHPGCTTSMAWPIVDGVLTALYLSAMAGASETSRPQEVATAGLFVGVTAVSAYVGYSRVSRCRDANERFQAAYPNGMYPYPYAQPYPQPYPPQQYPPQQHSPQPYPPAAQPQPYPAAQPRPYPPAPATQPAAVQPPPRVTAQPQPAPSVLGTEGDVCASTAECATGLSCSASNVCIRPPARAQ